MKRLLWLLLLPLLVAASALPARAQLANARGWCEAGAQVVVTSGLSSSTTVQASFPLCLISVSIHGGGVATIFSDGASTPLSNPFTSQTNGQWIFYAANGEYDITMTGAGLPAPVTYSDVFINASSGGGGSGIQTFTNGVLNLSQSALNLVNGAGVTITNTSGGNVSIAATGGICSASGGNGAVQVALNGACSGNQSFTAAGNPAFVYLQNGATFEIDDAIDPSNNNFFISGTHIFEVGNNANGNGGSGGIDIQISDSARPPFFTLALTNVSLTSNVLTITASGVNTFLGPGENASFSGLTNATFLNGQYAKVMATNATTAILLFTHADYPSAADTGVIGKVVGNGVVAYGANVKAGKPGGDTSAAQVIFDSVNGIPARQVEGYLASAGIQALNSGAEYTYGYDVDKTNGALYESSGVLVKSQDSPTNNHAYAIKVNRYVDGSSNQDTAAIAAYSNGTLNVSQTVAVRATEVVGGAVHTVGVGLSDITTSGGVDLDSDVSTVYTIKICYAGALDVWDWTNNGTTPTCTSSHVQGINLSGQVMERGIQITFAANTGHTLGDQWTVTVAVTYCHQYAGTGSPNGVLTGNICDSYEQSDGSTAGTLWLKQTGAGNTGWVAVVTAPSFTWAGITAGANSNAGTFSMSGNTWDVRSAAHTFPSVTVAASASLPAACVSGELGFVTGSTAGQNLWECNGGVWTQQLNSGAAGASTALSNLAAVAINTTLLPGAVNTVALGSNALSFTNVFLGTVANQSGSFNTANLTANRVINIPNATSTPVRDCPAIASNVITAIAVATGVCTQAQLASSDLSDAASIVTATSVTTKTNLTLNCESTGNNCSFPIKAFFGAAGCNNATAGNGFDIGVANAPTPACLGTIVRKGVLQFARGNTAYISWHLPADWNSSAATDIELAFTTTDTTNGHVTSWNIQTACNKMDGTVTDDPALNAFQALSVTTGASQVSGGQLGGTKTALTMTGCVADYNFEVAITRNNSGTDTNTDTAVALKFAEITTGVTKNATNR